MRHQPDRLTACEFWYPAKPAENTYPAALQMSALIQAITFLAQRLPAILYRHNLSSTSSHALLPSGQGINDCQQATFNNAESRQGPANRCRA